MRPALGRYSEAASETKGSTQGKGGERGAMNCIGGWPLKALTEGRTAILGVPPRTVDKLELSQK